MTQSDLAEELLAPSDEGLRRPCKPNARIASRSAQRHMPA